MASSLGIFGLLCLAAVATCAPQAERERRQLMPQRALMQPLLRQSAYYQPQLIQGGGYIQPQLIRGGGYIQPQLLQRGAYYQPQLLQRGAYYQPQMLQRGAYYQPQMIRGVYSQPQLLQSLPRRMPLQYSAQPSNVIISSPSHLLSAQPILRQSGISGATRTPAILRQAQDATLDGAYSYGFESEDGISVQTNAGPAVPVGPEETIQTVSGSFSYTAPDGTPITTNWVADENGYRAEGAHLPKGPLNK